MLQARLGKIQADDASGRVRLCFGSKKLFHAQFALQQQDFADHDAWKRQWDARRSNQFFVLGSKDEMSGCQGCQAKVAEDGSLELRLRLPDELGKHVVLTGVRFAYGQSQILAALGTSERIAAKVRSGQHAGQEISKRTGTALSYRLVRDDKGWRVFVSAQAPAIAITSRRDLGAIGVDANADHLAISETDRFGNLVHAAKLSTITYGKAAHQTQAILGDAAVWIAGRAKAASKPVVLELLDFQKKKAELGGIDPRQARMLCGFAYNKAAASIKAACFRAGVEVIEINPAYTSVMGAVSHARTKGISVHQGAAFAIARRGLSLSERPTVRTGLSPVRNGAHVTFELPVRNRSKHVWSFWSGVRTRLKAAHAAHIRCADHKRPAPPLSPSKQAVCATGSITVRARDASSLNCAGCDPFTDVPF